jgi:hypothetical protein
MASNKELVEQAEALAKDLGIEAKTQGLGNVALQQLVADLTAKAGEGSGGAPEVKPPEPPLVPQVTAPQVRPPFDGAGQNGSGGAPEVKPPEPPLVPQVTAPQVRPPFDGAGQNGSGGAPEVKPPEPPLVHTYQVARGKSLTSLKGILGQGAEVKPEYFNEDLAAGQATLEDLLSKGYVIEGKARGTPGAS